MSPMKSSIFKLQVDFFSSDNLEIKNYKYVNYFTEHSPWVRRRLSTLGIVPERKIQQVRLNRHPGQGLGKCMNFILDRFLSDDYLLFIMYFPKIYTFLQF